MGRGASVVVVSDPAGGTVAAGGGTVAAVGGTAACKVITDGSCCVRGATRKEVDADLRPSAAAPAIPAETAKTTAPIRKTKWPLTLRF